MLVLLLVSEIPVKSLQSAQKHKPTGAYHIPQAPVSFTEEIKKSRFITTLSHTKSVDEARAFIAGIRQQHPQARHHCWGFVAGSPGDSQALGFSDDGEPSGTAGKPILAQLMGSAIGEICAVVTRYSGGIKLGTGGLVKAYGGGVKQALQLLSVTHKKIVTSLVIQCNYSSISLVEQCLARFEGEQLNADYQGSGVVLELAVPSQQVDSFTQNLSNQSRGKIKVVKKGSE